LTGHSKGNLVISEALFALEDAGLGPADDTWIVTLSAVITMPRRFGNIIDVIGDIDWFGALNSVPLEVEERPALAWHGTNTELSFPLRVTQVFEKLIDERKIRL
jgi:hypothetical protein